MIWGKFNGFWIGGKCYNVCVLYLFDEVFLFVIGCVGGFVWEYLFLFDG